MHVVLGGPFSEQAQVDASGVRHERAHGGPLPASGGLRTEDAVRVPEGVKPSRASAGGH